MTVEAAALSADSELEALRRLECRYEAPKSLERFIAFLDLGFEPAAHHELLIRALEAIERGDIRRLMVLMPPGSAKSTYASQLFPPWYIGRNPQHSLIGVSNKTELAEKWSRRARNVLVRPEFRQVFGFGVNEQVSAVGSWRTSTSERSTGTGTPMTF